jgi:hypothetical protein
MKGAAGKTAANDEDNAFASLAKPKAKKVLIHTKNICCATTDSGSFLSCFCERILK